MQIVLLEIKKKTIRSEIHYPNPIAMTYFFFNI